MSKLTPSLETIGGYPARIWAGTRPGTVILIHGLGDSSEVWQATLEAHTNPRPKCIAIDLPGHGDTPEEPDTGDIEGLTRHLVKRLGTVAGPVWLVGHSLGGWVAALLAATRSDIEGVAVIDTASGYPETVRDRLMYHMNGLREGAAQKADFAEEMTDANPMADPEVTEAFYLRAARPGGAGWHMPLPSTIDGYLRPKTPLADMLAKLDCTRLFIRGGFSAVCTQTEADRLQEAVPDLRMALIERAGHAIPLERPNELAEVLESLYSR